MPESNKTRVHTRNLRDGVIGFQKLDGYFLGTLRTVEQALNCPSAYYQPLKWLNTQLATHPADSNSIILLELYFCSAGKCASVFTNFVCLLFDSEQMELPIVAR